MDSRHRVFELLEFSDEIFLNIFSNFGDFDLLSTARVCKRFDVIAKKTFASKYNGASKEKYYEIEIKTADTIYDHKMYRMFLETFGNEISAINFTSESGPNRYNMVKLISKHCRSIKYINIRSWYENRFNLFRLIQSMTKLISLTVICVDNTNFDWTGIRFPHLTTFAMEIVDMDVQVLKQFLYVNPQLEHLHIINCPKFPLEVIQALRDKMKRLKSLEYISHHSSFEDSCRDINMERLETLKISIDATSFRTLLGAIARGSKMIRSLEIIRYFRASPDEIDQLSDDVISLFDKLTSLRLANVDLTVDATRYLTQFLPHLVSLEVDGVQLQEFHSCDILFILKKCKHMKELVLKPYPNNDNKINTKEFDLNFHREFIEITKNRGDGVRFQVIQSGKKTIVTADKMIKDGELFYWNEYEAMNSRSKVHLLDLSDECLSRIYFYLDDLGERGLYETCTRTKQAMHDRIAKQVFTVSDLNGARDTFKRFGEHITKLAINLNASAQTAAAWNYIGTEFAQKLTELSLISVKVSAVESLRISFPNLITLKIMSVVTSRSHILPPMDCTKLTHIEFHKGVITFATKALNIGVTLDHLTTIKLSAISTNIVNILHLLDERICDQIQEFGAEHLLHTSLQNPHVQFANIAMRFKNLTTLNFLLNWMQETNTEYLFSTCSKIVKLTMVYYFGCEMDALHQTIRNIKANCKHLEVIQLLFGQLTETKVRKVLDHIADTFPSVQFNTIVHNDYNLTYKRKAYKRITEADRMNPF